MTIFSPVIAASLRRVKAQPRGVRVFRLPRATDAAAPSEELRRDVRRANVLAGWMDTQFSVLGFRFGADFIIGLIPGVGDTVAALAGCYPILVARRHRLGWRPQARMALNLAADWAIGLVPLVGDLFDGAFKANVRNVRILEDAAAAVRGV